MFINSLSKILCSDFHLMSAFEKTRYIFDQSIWECNGHFDHWSQILKALFVQCLEFAQGKLYPEVLMNTASNSSVERRMVNGRNAMAKCP